MQRQLHNQLFHRIQQWVHIRLQQERWHDYGTVTSYNPQDHTANVVLSQGQPVGPLPIQTLPGHAAPLLPGTQVEVTLDRGYPASIRGVLYSVKHPPIASDMALEGDASIGGVLTLGSLLNLGRVHTPPEPQPWMRGALCVAIQSPDGTAGTGDALLVCAQDATGALAWRTVTTG